jgi:RimJ/RimL family protein N-acetyltransferase
MIYSIPRYPVHLIDVVRLASGHRVTIRPTLPQDAELQQDFFRSLSAKSRFFRFMTQLRELPPSLTQRFSTVDHQTHVALLAEVYEGGQTMVGEARYVVDESDPHTCELAIAVNDAWQEQGIARAMLTRLERAAASAGLLRIVADTLFTNRAMIGLGRRAGYSITADREDAGVARLEKILGVTVPTDATRSLAA